MTTAAEATDVWAGIFAAARPRLPGGDLLGALRAAALADLTATGFPTRRQEAWLYTDLASVTDTTFAAPEAASPATLDRAARLLSALPAPDARATRLVFVNGRVAPALSTTTNLPDGVELVSLGAVLARDGDADLASRIGSLVDGRGHPLAGLNTALFEDGVLLRVRRGVRVGTPLHVVFLTVGGPSPSAVHPRLVYHVEDDAEVALVERWTGETGSPWLSNAVVEAWVGANAGLDLLEVQEQSLETRHFRSLRVQLARGGRLAVACLSIGAGLARNDVHVRLAGTGAECRLDGLTLVQGDQHTDHQTRIDHAEPHGTSLQLYKGILDDRAQSVFSGRVLVEPHAQKTDARQANHSLLLSDEAEADAKPQLEILADDVKCAHGATVGQLDEEALFYLRSRGIGPRSAQRMLLHAFASEIVERMPHAELAAMARAVLDRHLPGGEG